MTNRFDARDGNPLQLEWSLRGGQQVGNDTRASSDNVGNLRDIKVGRQTNRRR